MSTYDDIVEKHRKNSEAIVDKHRNESEKRLDKMNKNLNRLEDLSINNFASWRDYLYKYYSVILILIGATGILQSTKLTDPWFKFGIFTTLAGIFIGYFFINLFFYFERRWFQGQDAMGIPGTESLQQHPDAIEGDIKGALILHQQDYIKKLKLWIKEAKTKHDKPKIKLYKKYIGVNKRLIFATKLIGEQFGTLERLWLWGVTISFALTVIGLFIVFLNIT